MTSEQLLQARAERMRQNGLGTLTLDEARTWIEETGLCLFLPRRQFSSSVAPSFVEAIAGRPEVIPDPKIVAIAEDLLIRLENEGVAVRLNLQGQPGEQPDFVVAAWVLPYVYALRGDRDWRRSPQLTGSRQVSQLAVHVYKQLEGGDANVSQLKQALGREVSESAVVRAITELWQQLRIIPVIAARGQAAKWQLLRTRFQRAIAEGASTSQVTAISVLASIYLQAVIAASMEDVELFLAALTARSKIREVIRGLVATRQVHTISLGHAPHFYVAGTLPEFEPVSTMYASSSMPASAYFLRSFERDEEAHGPAISLQRAPSRCLFRSRQRRRFRSIITCRRKTMFRARRSHGPPPMELPTEPPTELPMGRGRTSTAPLQTGTIASLQVRPGQRHPLPTAGRPAGVLKHGPHRTARRTARDLLRARAGAHLPRTESITAHMLHRATAMEPARPEPLRASQTATEPTAMASPQLLRGASAPATPKPRSRLQNRRPHARKCARCARAAPRWPQLDDPGPAASGSLTAAASRGRRSADEGGRNSRVKTEAKPCSCHRRAGRCGKEHHRATSGPPFRAPQP